MLIIIGKIIFTQLLIANVVCSQLGNINFVFLVDWTYGDDMYYREQGHVLEGPEVGCAAAVAMKEIQKRQLLYQYNLDGWEVIDTHCASTSLRKIDEVWAKLPDKILHALVGPGCSPCGSFADYASSFSIPQVTYVH